MPDLIFENYAVMRFLHALDVPFHSLKHGDQPDFVLDIGDQKIGLEVCDATPEEYHRATKELHKKEWPGCVDASNLQNRSQRRPTREIISEVTCPYGQWQDSGEIHERWRMGMKRRLHDKERAFQNPEFSRFDQNWLLIHDAVTAPIDNSIDLDLMSINLLYFAASYAPPDYFDKVWIDFGKNGLVGWSISEQKMVWKQIN
jgi:hypothetical protein